MSQSSVRRRAHVLTTSTNHLIDRNLKTGEIKMQRIMRALAALSVVLSLMFVAAPTLSPQTASAATNSNHNGRLGGSQATFNSRFGTGTKGKSTTTYEAVGFRAIVVKFDKDRAVDIAIAPQTGSAWSSDEARQAATDLLPKDVDLSGDALDTGDGRLEIACTSADLAQQFSKSDYKRLKHAGNSGDCFDLESPDGAGTVGSLELSIGRAGSLDRPAPTPTDIPPTATAIPIPPTATPDLSTSIGSDGCTYRNVDGQQISCPVVSPSGPPAGATAECNDGTYSFATHHQGQCSSHGGVAIFYQ